MRTVVVVAHVVALLVVGCGGQDHQIAQYWAGKQGTGEGAGCYRWDGETWAAVPTTPHNAFACLCHCTDKDPPDQGMVVRVTSTNANATRDAEAKCALALGDPCSCACEPDCGQMR